MQVEQEEKIAEFFAEIFLLSVKDHVERKGKIYVKNYQTFEDYVVGIFSDVLIKVNQVKSFNPDLFRKSIRKRKDLFAKYVSFSS